MVKYYPQINIWGENFSPERVEHNEELFSSMTIKGTVGKRGRYINKPIPYGSACIEPPDSVSGEDNKISYVLDVYKKHKDNILTAGASDIIFYIAVEYKDQCNLAFEPEMIAKIAELQIPFTITCFESDGDW